MESDYPRYYHQIQGLIGTLSEALPLEMEAFRNLHKEATADGVLDRKTKELIALGIAMNVNCDGCIAYHVKDALLAVAATASPFGWSAPRRSASWL